MKSALANDQESSFLSRGAWIDSKRNQKRCFIRLYFRLYNVLQINRVNMSIDTMIIRIVPGIVRDTASNKEGIRHLVFT